MLKTHMDAKENLLVATSRVPANAGHPNHKGTPREAFIREFLESHLPANVAIGSGEIIDAASQPNTQRNQFDIVIYRRNYPKLDFGGGISGFLIESVIATIEVKSTLTQRDLENAAKAARASKALNPNVITSLQSGFIPPRVLNYVVAYDGPASMQTVYGWLPPIHAGWGVTIAALPADGDQQLQTPSPSLDGIFVLQKGFVYFDNVPYGFASDANPLVGDAHDSLGSTTFSAPATPEAGIRTFTGHGAHYELGYQLLPTAVPASTFGRCYLTISSETGVPHSACLFEYPAGVRKWFGFKPVAHLAPVGPGFLDTSDRKSSINHYIRLEVPHERLLSAEALVVAKYSSAFYTVTVQDCVSLSADVARQCMLRVADANFTPFGLIAYLNENNSFLQWDVTPYPF